MNVQMRVIGKMYKSYNQNSDEYTETLIQYLQENRKIKLFGVSLFSFWKTIDKEIVPSFAWIQRNALGFTDWKSKWYLLENVSWSKNNS
jgi:hypothetical protein